MPATYGTDGIPPLFLLRVWIQTRTQRQVQPGSKIIVGRKISVNQIVITRTDNFICYEIRVVIPLGIHPVLLFVLLDPVVLIVAYIIFGTRPHQQVIKESATTVSGSHVIGIKALIISQSSVKREFLPLHITRHRISDLIQFLVRILSFIIHMGQWSAYTSIFTFLRDTYIVVCHHTQLLEVLQIVFAFRYQRHVYPFVRIRIILQCRTPDVQLISPYISSGRIGTLWSGTVWRLHFRLSQISGRKHRTAIHSHIQSLFFSLFGSNHHRTGSSTCTIQGRSRSSFQDIDRLDIISSYII